MILVWGSEGDAPVRDILDELRSRGAGLLHVDRARLAEAQFDVKVDPGLSGWLTIAGTRVAVEDIEAIYLRPEPEGRRTRGLATACLLAIASLADAIVVNRPMAGRSNLSKPYQLSLIAEAGLSVPPTLVTSDPGAARAFLQAHERVIYKSISGIRSIVSMLDGDDGDRLDAIGTGPVQFQRWIAGTDVRVHIVGDRCFATTIHSEATDYRYPAQTQDLEVGTCELDEGIAEKLVRLAAGMDLLVAGIDLRRTPDGEWFCLEVNPSPGFTFYEDATGQPITAAIADLLEGRAPLAPRDRAPRLWLAQS